MKNYIQAFIIIAIIFFVAEAYCQWDTEEQLLFGTYIAANVIDIGQTTYSLNRGGAERNPVFGRNPDPWVFISAKVIGVSLVYYFLNKLSNKKLPLYILNSIQIGAVVYNSRSVGVRLEFKL